MSAKKTKTSAHKSPTKQVGDVTYPTATIAAALRATDGKVFLAAERVGCSPDAIYTRIKQEPALAALVADLRGKLVDLAETSLKRGVLSGDGWAVIFTLKTLGKDRGYVERSEVTGKDGAPIQTEEVSLTDPQRLERLAALYDRARTRRVRQADRSAAKRRAASPDPA